VVNCFIPSTLKEVLDIIQKEDTQIFAGGTDLMVKKKSWSGTIPNFVKPVVFVNKLKELKEIRIEGNCMIIGSGCTFSEIIKSNIVPDFLKRVSLNVASPAIRNIATIGGNICNGSPAADILPPLYAVGAEVVLESIAGIRKLPIENFILGPGRTDIKQWEILKDIIIPIKNYSSCYYKKVGTRKSTALSKLSFFGFVKVEQGIIQDIGIAFGAVAPTVVAAREIEISLKGMKVADFVNIKGGVIEGYSKLIKPIDDQRSTAEYRKQVAMNLLEDFLSKI
jgi:xanthine dehydrogenase FAD-binding subunit